MGDADDTLPGPVCLVRQNGQTLELCDEGLELLLSHDNLPIAAVTVAGLYRTGKSFFLNQLAGTHGFKVGSTIQSCTRGIWMWPVSDTRWQSKEHPNARLVLFDTEGLASMDNDDNYDARIFALGILLSSFFVYNSMGVIDESAIDRLLLVSELTKSICMSQSGGREGEEGDEEDEDDVIASGGAMTESQHAEFFPPFLWLLRDFSLQLERDGKPITEQDYLEHALEDRPGSNARIRDHNQVRQSFRSLFKDRQCRTLIRPVTNESDLHQLADLSRPGFRPEFLTQLDDVTNSVLTKVQPKTLFGRPITGHMLASLARSFVDAINSGVVPDIKKGYEYMVDESFRCAFEATLSRANAQMRDQVMSTPLMTRAEFDAVEVSMRREAFEMFHTKSSVGGSGVAAVGTSGQRAHWTTKLSEELDKIVNDALGSLETASQSLCQDAGQAALTQLRGEIESGQFDVEPSGIVAAVERATSSYIDGASGPAVAAVGFRCSTGDWMAGVGQGLKRVEHAHTLAEQEHVRALENEQQERKRVEQALQANEEKLSMVRTDNERLGQELASEKIRSDSLEEQVKTSSSALDSLRLEHVGLQRDLESAQQQMVRERDQANEVATRLATNLEAMSNKLENLDASHSNVKDQLNAAERENDGLKRDVQEATRAREQEQEHAATRHQQMEAEVARQRAEFERVVEKLEETREANVLLQERLVKAQGDCEQTQERAIRQQEELQESIDSAENTIRERESTIQETTKECQRLQEALDAQVDLRTTVERNLEDVMRDGTDLSAELEATRAQLTEVQDVAREKSEQVETMRTELSALTALTQEEEKKFSDVLRGVEAELTDERERMEEIQEQNRVLQASLDELKKQSEDEGSDFQQRLDALVARESELIAQVSAGEEAYAEKDDMLVQVQAELDHMRKSSEDQRSELNAEREELVVQLKAQSDSYTELMSEHQQLGEIVAQLTEQLRQQELDSQQSDAAASQRNNELESQLGQVTAQLAEIEQHANQVVAAKELTKQEGEQRARLLEREVQALHDRLSEAEKAAQQALQAKELSTIAHNDAVAMADEERQRVAKVEVQAAMEDMKIKVKEQLQLDRARELESKLRVVSEERNEIKHRLQVLIMQAAQLPEYLQEKLFASPDLPDENHVTNW